MINLTSAFTQIVKRLSVEKSTLLLSSLILLPEAAVAGPIDIDFKPPEIVTEHRCFSQKSDVDILNFWAKWDGKKLPGWDANLIQYDMRRLRDKEPVKYFDTVTRIIDLMPTVRSNYSQTKQDQDLVRLYLAAGRDHELKGTGRVERLLSNAENASPGLQNYLADILLEGELANEDIERGQQLKVRAAYGGNADALLYLADIYLQGQTVENWNVEPKIAATMAFGALVGKLDGGFCDRVGRIAREFSKGVVVQQNHYTSEAWYKLIADMGDINAAWKVAEYHLQGQEIEKSNETLLKYIKVAADGKLTQAQLAYGRILEAGSIIDQDLSAAKDYYQAVADTGNRAGNIRIVRLIEEWKDFTGADRPEYKVELRNLVNAGNAPGWAYTRLSRLIVEDEGRWAAEAEVLPMLEKAAALEDSDGKRDLVRFLLHDYNNKEKFGRALDILDDLVFSTGAISPMAELYRIHVCVDPFGPNISAAKNWEQAELAAGNTTLLLEPDNVTDALIKYDPEALARVQTQALYQRANAMAIHIQIMRNEDADEDRIKFWENVSKSILNYQTTNARLQRDLSEVNSTKDEVEIDRLISLLEQALENGEKQAELDFAEVVMIFKGDDDALMHRTLTLLKKNAEEGSGRAFDLLTELSYRRENISTDALYQNYISTINKRGDFGAQLFAAVHANDIESRKEHYRKALAVMPCTFKNVAKLVDFSLQHPEVGEVDRWLDVAEIFAEDDGWNNVVIGDLIWDEKDDAAQMAAIEKYEDGRLLGDTTAMQRLLAVYGTNFGKRYNAQYASNIFSELLESSPAGELPKLLTRLRKSTVAIREEVTQNVDIFQLYRNAARSGHPAVMREYGLQLRAKGVEENQVAYIQEANDWIKKSAEARDVRAMLLLAEIYALGLGVEASRSQAVEWLELASSLGAAEADQLLAAMNL
jgi:TPR repeat protein